MFIITTKLFKIGIAGVLDLKSVENVKNSIAMKTNIT